jgi:hypothetical protein
MDATRPAAVVPSRVVDAADRFGATGDVRLAGLLDTLSRSGLRLPTVGS